MVSSPQGDRPVSPRVQCARLGWSVDISAETIRRYIHTDNEAGLTGLQADYGQGRPLTVTWTKEQWLDRLAQSPANLPLLNTADQNWTQAMLCRYLESYHQIAVTQTTLSKTLRRVGVVWWRAKRRIHSPDPLYVVKRQRVADLEQLAASGSLTTEAAAHPRSDVPPKPATLVFLDSTDLHWCPDIGATYGPFGQQAKVETWPGESLVRPFRQSVLPRALYGPSAQTNSRTPGASSVIN